MSHIAEGARITAALAPGTHVEEAVDTAVNAQIREMPWYMMDEEGDATDEALRWLAETCRIAVGRYIELEKGIRGPYG